MNNVLAHHKYVDKYRSKNGKWVYVYPDGTNKSAVNSAKEAAKEIRERRENGQVTYHKKDTSTKPGTHTSSSKPTGLIGPPPQTSSSSGSHTSQSTVSSGSHAAQSVLGKNTKFLGASTVGYVTGFAAGTRVLSRKLKSTVLGSISGSVGAIKKRTKRR